MTADKKAKTPGCQDFTLIKEDTTGILRKEASVTYILIVCLQMFGTT